MLDDKDNSTAAAVSVESAASRGWIEAVSVMKESVFSAILCNDLGNWVTFMERFVPQKKKSLFPVFGRDHKSIFFNEQLVFASSNWS
jgi:hypothetical protein